MSGRRPWAEGDVRGATCVVTGASSGIGRAIARGLAHRGATVGVVGRNPERTEAAVEDVLRAAREGGRGGSARAFRADFSSLASVVALADAIEAAFPPLDVLVNNAGLWHNERKLSADGFEDTFQVNVLAPAMLTLRLVPAMMERRRGRVVHVSSMQHKAPKAFPFDDLQQTRRRFRGIRVYGESKLGNVLFSNELARRLEGTGVTSNAVHPGTVVTNVVRDNAFLSQAIKVAAPFLLTPDDGAVSALRVATDPSLAHVSGRYFDHDGSEGVPSAPSKDARAAERLWGLVFRMGDLDPASLPAALQPR
ncbi:MAG: SDR family oxidoreductase [Myxococcota bacterium]